MADKWFIPDDKTPPPDPNSLAEEQRRAFDEDRRRVRKPLLTLRWSGPLFRN